MPFCRKRNGSARPVGEVNGHNKVSLVASRRAGNDGAWKGSLGCHELERQIGPVTKIAQDAAALLGVVVPVAVGDLVSGDKPVNHQWSSLCADRFLQTLEEPA